MKSFVAVIAALQLALVAGADLCDPTFADDSSQQICGETQGDFQLLGSLCFSGAENGEEDRTSTVNFTLTFNVGTSLTEADLAQYYVLFYDDAPDSFAAVNRMTDDLNYQNCSEREALSKGICSSTKCLYGWHVTNTASKTTVGSLTSYSKSITISEAYAREWYFVLSACDIDTPIQINSYVIGSENAVDCSAIYGFNDAGYIAAIVVLSLTALGLVFTSFFFYKRTKIPELLSMDDTGYNEL